MALRRNPETGELENVGTENSAAEVQKAIRGGKGGPKGRGLSAWAPTPQEGPVQPYDENMTPEQRAELEARNRWVRERAISDSMAKGLENVGYEMHDQAPTPASAPPPGLPENPIQLEGEDVMGPDGVVRSAAANARFMKLRQKMKGR